MSKWSAENCGPVSHDEALNIAMGYIDKAFGNEEKIERRITHSIPANCARDSDLRLTAYIEQQRQKDEELSAARASAWIPCSERMPDDDVDVLGCRGDYFFVCSYQDDDEDGGTWFDDNGGGLGAIEQPTHWTPLPSPPAKDP